jgi:hypothetical protein
VRMIREIRTRLQLIAHERGIDKAKINAALASGQRLVDFAIEHRLSIDWLVYGDLHGLQRQTLWKLWGRVA